MSERLPVGRDIAFFHANRHDGRKTGKRVVHKRHSARFSRRWRNRNQCRRTRRYLAAAFRRSAGLDARLSAGLLHCRRHRASRRAAHRRLRLDLARRRRIQLQRPGSQDCEEHRRDDLGEESHASVLRMPILSVPVCDLNHKLETFSSRLRLEPIQLPIEENKGQGLRGPHIRSLGNPPRHCRLDAWCRFRPRRGPRRPPRATPSLPFRARTFAAHIARPRSLSSLFRVP